MELAKKLNGEVISADSMQIYKQMNIGTAKPSLEEMQNIPHHLIDIVNPDEEYNVSLYKDAAIKTINDIINRGKTPIIVGGTGLYINTLVNGIEFSEIPNDDEYVKELEALYEKGGADALFDLLKKVDEESSKVIEKNNIRRVIRALEIFKTTGKTKSELDRESQKETPFDYLVYGIEWDREILYERINKRVDLMIEAGLVDEVKNVTTKFKVSKTAMQALGYKEVVDYLNEKTSYDEMIDTIKQESRRYAKRQVTWFKKTKGLVWLDGSNQQAMIDRIIDDYNKR